MPVPEMIHQLVERFEENREAYRSGKYNETQLRLEFLDPFFEALGWDMYNKQGYAPDYRDVIHEDSIEIENVAKAPDYAFKIGKERKFFVEAKKPAVNIQFDIHPAYQLRRYAWNVRLPLSILTDFEEFAVYDCRNKPDPRDSAAAGRVLFFTYRQYLEKWDEIAAIFSRQAVLKGSFDQYAAGVKGKRGTLEVDDAFLAEIERWRDLLARNLALRNPAIANEHQLNYAVQMTIDRIIFLRICEDRGVEPEDQLRLVARLPGVYTELLRLFKRADMKYNSGLFHFSDESGQVSAADTFTPSLKIDDKVLKDILTSLYFPCPYIFKEIPVEILGQVYERFLGKVIRLTAGHQAKVEEKPEVRKAGGVYYTPTYIVNYIVQNTVGKLLEGKTPEQAANLKLLDPACGSGSFLLGAYQYLLDWHLGWYSGREPEKWAKGKKPTVYQVQGGEWRLTTAEKKRILLNNIFGVDIDPQAVEVTKLSLLLKVLEGETGQLSLGLERVLPDLGQNIQCGNSLIGPDYYEGYQLSLGLLDEQERYRINAFDWQAAFPQIFIAGGFDIVIGNPPYLISAGQTDINYFNKNFTLIQYQTDFYVYFIERAIHLSRKNGKVSFIVSDSWLNSEYFTIVRNHLLSEHRIEQIAVFDYPVFSEAALENSIFVITTYHDPEKFPIIFFSTPSQHTLINEIEPKEAIERGMIDPHWSAEYGPVIRSIEKGSHSLEHYLRINRGIHAYRTDGYGKSKFGSGPQTKKDKELRSYHAKNPLDQTYMPELKGKDVHRFSYKPTGNFLSYGPWLAEPREPEFFIKPKVVLRKILGPKLHGTFIEEPTAIDQSLYVLISEEKDIPYLKFTLGIMLSRLGAWYLRKKYSIYDTLYPWYTKKQLATFPMKKMDDHLVSLVERMLALHKQTPRTPQEQAMLQREIAATDAHIDRLVYELYGLTEDEIKIVENK